MKLYKKLVTLIVAILLSSAVASAQSQPLSFILDKANCSMNDPGLNGYGMVTLVKKDNCVTITVAPNEDFFIGGTNFGVQQFSFSCVGNFAEEDFNVPQGWDVTLKSVNHSMFGVFVDNFTGTGSTRKNPLEITVCSNNIPNLDLSNFLILSSDNRKEPYNEMGGYLFAVHIADFKNEGGEIEAGVSSCWFSAVPKPTFAEEIDFSAKTENKQVKLQWTAISEENVLGYKILRAHGMSNNYVQINDNMISAKGSIQTTVDYEYTDTTIKNRLFATYKLLEIGTDGIVKEHGPVFVILK